MTRLRVAVLMGGPSAEREVSLLSGQTAAQALMNAGMNVCEVHVEGAALALPKHCDVAFIALHGRFGEDGTVQRLLEDRGVTYTGSGPAASALAMDKTLAKQKFVEAGIPTPRWVVVERDLRHAADLPLPAVVKPAREGSSVGISIVENEAQLNEACLQAWRHDGRLLVEEYIRGREFTVGILGERALPVLEIKTGHKFFDYRAKYTKGEATEEVAKLDAVTAARLQDLALRAHECLGCRDMSRVDLMMDEAGNLFVLEVNTIPGLTPNSLLPKAAAAAGLSFQELCGRMVEMAMARREMTAEVVAA
jgi:D-alanine-D-alanine ligase